MTNLDSILKSRDITLSTKVPFSQGSGFSISHVWMWELDYKESWALKNWCFWTVVLEKTLESPLDCKEVQPVHPKGDQSWVFIGRTDVEAGTPIFWPPAAKSWLICKDRDDGKDWGREKGTTEDEMVGCHHRLDGREFGWTLGVDDGQGGLVCCNPWGHKESDTTEWLNWTELDKCWVHWCCWLMLSTVNVLLMFDLSKFSVNNIQAVFKILEISLWTGTGVVLTRCDHSSWCFIGFLWDL